MREPLNINCIFEQAIAEIADECERTLEHVQVHIESAQQSRDLRDDAQYFHEVLSAACILLGIAKQLSGANPGGFKEDKE